MIILMFNCSNSTCSDNSDNHKKIANNDDNNNSDNDIRQQHECSRQQ